MIETMPFLQIILFCNSCPDAQRKRRGLIFLHQSADPAEWIPAESKAVPDFLRACGNGGLSSQSRSRHKYAHPLQVSGS